MHPPPDSFVPAPRAARFDLLVRGAPVPSPCVPRDAGWYPARRRSDRSAAPAMTIANTADGAALHFRCEVPLAPSETHESRSGRVHVSGLRATRRNDRDWRRAGTTLAAPLRASCRSISGGDGRTGRFPAGRKARSCRAGFRARGGVRPIEISAATKRRSVATQCRFGASFRRRPRAKKPTLRKDLAKRKEQILCASKSYWSLETR